MVEYRIRRLAPARRAAQALGCRGARFPWESDHAGDDVTPSQVVRPDGVALEVLTGRYEEHIVADVAWAAHHYTEWTGDRALFDGEGAGLVVETARYWADRIQVDATGGGHIDSVIGPDEYHEKVDDNAFTNVMARWNLRAGADLLERAGGREEAAAWRHLADQVVDGWDAERGIYEQFAGYFGLEPLTMAQVGPPPLVADVVLGTERLAGSQILKQADVLMLHHLVPGEVVPGSLGPCLDFYEPRTAHGSSLSPAIYAALAGPGRTARPGRRAPADGCPHRPRRPHRHDRRRAAHRHHGRPLAGAGLRVPRACGPGAGSWPSTRACRPAWEALSLRVRFEGAPIGVRAEHGRCRSTAPPRSPWRWPAARRSAVSRPAPPSRSEGP